MLQRWMKTKKDPEHKDWEVPLTKMVNPFVTNKCVGKNVTDCVESSICAVFLSNNCLRTALEYITKIKLVPIGLTDVIHKF